MKFNFPMNNFTQGEWGPKMQGRVDLPGYANAAAEMTNFIPQTTGGVQYRGGTSRLVMTTTDIAQVNGLYREFCTIVPYLNSDSSKSRLLHIAFYNNLAPMSVTHFAINGDVGTGTQQNLLDMASVGFPAEYANPSAAMVNGPWHYQQVGDYLIFTTPHATTATESCPPFVFYYDKKANAYRFVTWMLARYLAAGNVAGKHWAAHPWTDPVAIGSGPSFTLSAVTVGTGRTLTMSSAYFTSTTSGTEWIGMYIRGCKDTSPAVDEGIAVITGWTSSTVVTVTIIKAFQSGVAFGSTTNPDTFWQIGAWGGTDGHPRTLVSFQQRLFFARGNKVWASQSGNIFNFEEIPSTNTTGPFGYANQAYTAQNIRSFSAEIALNFSKIHSMVAGKVLVLVTDSAEIVLYGTDGAVGPLNLTFESSSSIGSHAPVQAIRTDSFVTFAAKGGTRLRDMEFSFNQDQYKTKDISLPAEHYFSVPWNTSGKDTIKTLVQISNKYPFLFVLTNEGRLFGINLDREYGVAAWFRVTFNYSTTNNSEFPPYFALPQIYSICPTLDGEGLYIHAETTANGEGHIFKMSMPYENDHPNDPQGIVEDLTPPLFLDFAEAATATAALPSTTWKTRISGSYTSNYRNKTVSVVADGVYIGDITVANDSDGTFTLERAASKVFVGYRYSGILRTLPIEQGGQYGIPVGRQKRIDEVVIKFFKSLGTKYGRTKILEQGPVVYSTHYTEDMYTIPFRENYQRMGDPTLYFTGDKVITFPPGYERSAQITIVQDVPYPCYITGIVAKGVTYD
jgi:hypothetical protein